MWWDNLLKPVDSLINLGSEYIVDKDKLIEFQFKAMELKQNSIDSLVGMKTVAWVDAVVKLMFALKSLMRPIIGGMMTMFGAYCHYKGITMDVGLHAIFDGAFPAWGVSRHAEKVRDKKKETSWEWEE